MFLLPEVGLIAYAVVGTEPYVAISEIPIEGWRYIEESVGEEKQKDKFKMPDLVKGRYISSERR